MLPLLLAGSSLRILLTLAHYYLVAAFVQSKPPGRKMVGKFIVGIIISMLSLCIQRDNILLYILIGYLGHQCVCSTLQ